MDDLTEISFQNLVNHQDANLKENGREAIEGVLQSRVEGLLRPCSNETAEH